MSKVAPQVPAQLLPASNAFTLIPNRMIGKMPVFEDEHGEFVLITVKVAHLRTKTEEEIQVKVDAEIEAIRNVHSLTLRLSEEIDRKAKKTEGTLGYVVHKNNGRNVVSGETSLPRTLFGKDYHYARHIRDDDRDFRKSAFQPKEKKVN